MYPGESRLIECFTFESGRLVANANGLQWNRCQRLPVWSLCDLSGKPACIVEVTAQTGLNSLNAVNADVIPEFEGAKASAQRNSPVAILCHGVVNARAHGPLLEILLVSSRHSGLLVW